MYRTKFRSGCVLLAALLVMLAFFALCPFVFARAETPADSAEETPARYKAVDALREGAEANGWSVAVYADGALTPVPAAADDNYTYYTTQVAAGYKYTHNADAFAFVPDEITYTTPGEWVGEDRYLEKEYGFVLKNAAPVPRKRFTFFRKINTIEHGMPRAKACRAS